jgi:hypothetical protein
LVLIAGDGIREGLQSLTDLVNRAATKAFSFGLIEVALYRFGKNRFVMQPRVLAETEVMTRQVIIVADGNSASTHIMDEHPTEPRPPLDKGRGHLPELESRHLIG